MTEPRPCPDCDATQTIYTPERVAEVRGHAACFEAIIENPATEPDRRAALEGCLADALAWLEEAEQHG